MRRRLMQLLILLSIALTLLSVLSHWFLLSWTVNPLSDKSTGGYLLELWASGGSFGMHVWPRGLGVNAAYQDHWWGHLLYLPGPGGTYIELTVVGWLVLCVVWAIPACWLVAKWFGWYRRLCGGFCVKCGYNLRGNTSGVCSECGRKIPGSQLGLCREETGERPWWMRWFSPRRIVLGLIVCVQIALLVWAVRWGLHVRHARMIAEQCAPMYWDQYGEGWKLVRIEDVSRRDDEWLNAEAVLVEGIVARDGKEGHFHLTLFLEPARNPGMKCTCYVDTAEVEEDDDYVGDPKLIDLPDRD